MYRCKDCQREYIKPVEYCECGNNTFDFIEENITVNTENNSKQAMTLEQKSQFVSIIFFVLCIILSLVVWFIPIKEEKNVHVKEVETKSVIKDIPNIDKIWDSTPVKIKEIVQKVEEPVLKETVPLRVIPYDNVTKTKTVQTAPKQTNTQKPKTQSEKIKPAQQQTKPVTQPKKQESVNPSQTKPVQQAKPVEQVQSKPSKQEIKQEKPKTSYNPNSAEMLRYKGALRAALFSKLPLNSIQGSGSCSVHFSIDSTGKLVNRGFSKQSDNKSLNDAVYYMLMSVPKYSAPPAEYSGETINMNILINNGNYEISIH